MKVSVKFMELIKRATKGHISMKMANEELHQFNMFFDEVDLSFEGQVSFWYDSVQLAECTPNVVIELQTIKGLQGFHDESMEEDDYGVNVYLENGMEISITMESWRKNNESK